MTRTVIVNADDFGLCPEVNEAVALAHRQGVLSSASLLVNGAAAAGAVALARELPALGVGLHLCLSELRPLTEAPHLAPGGRFPRGHGVVYARVLAGLIPEAELRAEIAAQLDAALATGLTIDHVDGHGHVHVLPPVLRLLVPLCREREITAMRWPAEPVWSPASSLGGRARRAVLRRWCAVEPPLAAPAACFGIACAGRMTLDSLRAVSSRLPAGCSEIGLHPATVNGLYPGYQGAAELAALCDAAAAAALPPRATYRALAQALGGK